MTCTARSTPDTPQSCAKTGQYCYTPYMCRESCKLITANSDGSDPHQPAAPAVSHIEHLARWLVLTAAMYGAVYLITGLSIF